MANETYLTVSGWTAARPIFYPEKINEETGEVQLPAATIVRIGVTSRFYSRTNNRYEDGVTSWYSVRSHAQLAKNVASCVTRGTPLLVRGRLQQRNYSDKDGVQRTEQVIVADSIGVDLKTGIAHYNKTNGESYQPLPNEARFHSASERDDLDASFEVPPCECEADCMCLEEDGCLEENVLGTADEFAEGDPAGVLAHV